MKSNLIYEFQLVLRDSNPKIKRTIQVSSKITLADFVYIILVLFEMHASHLFEVKVLKGKMLVESYKKKLGKDFDSVAFRKEFPLVSEMVDVYKLPHPENDFYDEGTQFYTYNIIKSKLNKVVSQVGEQMELWYDFGDDWFVDIKLKKIIEMEKEEHIPVVITGSGFGIIEDCGGVWTLNEIYADSLKPESEANKGYKEWLDFIEFEFHEFNLEEMNERIKIIPSIYKNCYEKNYRITDEERAYVLRQTPVTS